MARLFFSSFCSSWCGGSAGARAQARKWLLYLAKIILNEELRTCRCVLVAAAVGCVSRHHHHHHHNHHHHHHHHPGLCLNAEVSPLCPPLKIHCMLAFLYLCVLVSRQCFQYSRCFWCFAYEKHLITASAVPCLPNAIQNKHAVHLTTAAATLSSAAGHPSAG